MHPQREIWRTVRWLGTLAIFFVGAYFLLLTPLQKLLRGARDDVDRNVQAVLAALTQRDTRVVEGRAEITGESEISELALLEMRMSATRSIEKSEKYGPLPLGTKRLIVRGNYRVKAGYKLRPGVSLRVEHGTPVASFPKPEILSVELIDYQTLSEDDGWLNQIQPADRAQILREMRAQMIREAEASGMLDAVESTLSTRVRDLFGAKSAEVEHLMP